MKYIVKISTTGLNPVNDYIYRVVIKSVETERVFDKFISNCPNSAIMKCEVLKDYDKEFAISQKETNGVTLKSIANVLKQVIEGNEIIGFNVSFDLNFILYKLNMNNVSLNIGRTTIFDLLEKEREKYQFDVESVATRELGIQYDSNQHFNALYNTEVYQKIYEKMIETSPESKSIWGMNRFVDEDGVFKIGKYKGLSIKDTKRIPRDYYDWLKQQDDVVIKYILTKIIG